MTLPGENGQNLVEWRFRKEQTRGKVIVFGRKLRVSRGFANLIRRLLATGLLASPSWWSLAGWSVTFEGLQELMQRDWRSQFLLVVQSILE